MAAWGVRKTRKIIRRGRVLVPIPIIERRILFIRGRRVMLDADLAALYGVTVRRLKEQVRRNRLRFPSDFLFVLSSDEKAEVVANCDHLHHLRFSPHAPLAFTEHGAVMLANVLKSSAAARMSVHVVRAFVRLREALRGRRDLERKLDELEASVAQHDARIQAIFLAVRRLVAPRRRKRRAIGFVGGGG